MASHDLPALTNITHKYKISIIILILQLSVCECVTYEQEVTGSHSTSAKNIYFSSSLDLTLHEAALSDTARNGTSGNYSKRAAGRN